ncbi:hypothetical protein AVEN_251302-1 [Araneus ventricosus]|uniref:Uncharacterized protein n=1 Tax=Araneus ventricosus TaxID=182803 RepID=A0A4Y2RGZ7_ARAVE|nr:hypothetical protein AVEN_251302-1 [Araneus ventricosus]
MSVCPFGQADRTSRGKVSVLQKHSETSFRQKRFYYGKQLLTNFMLLAMPRPDVGFGFIGMNMRGTISIGTMEGATDRNILLNESWNAAPLVGGIENRPVLILVDDLRNAAYL